MKVNIRQDCAESEVARYPTWPVPTFRQDPVVLEDKEEIPPPKKKVPDDCTLRNVT